MLVGTNLQNENWNQTGIGNAFNTFTACRLVQHLSFLLIECVYWFSFSPHGIGMFCSIEEHVILTIISLVNFFFQVVFNLINYIKISHNCRTNLAVYEYSPFECLPSYVYFCLYLCHPCHAVVLCLLLMIQLCPNRACWGGALPRTEPYLRHL